ncbi:MAG: imidazole glycerol phosphate synthase subunit HisH [Fimbriimonadaceae bacterium]|nr:imidazole glycerol phosphate synthase subunit HisH [Fimbriimonadaceae bacterium]
MSQVVVVDYGIGNLLSVCRAIEAQGGAVTLTGNPDEIRRADRVVLPGVGAFGKCVSEVRRLRLESVLNEYRDSGRPLLGICVGMQMLFTTGEEFGEHEGLGFLPGRVVAIPPDVAGGGKRKIPHIGWNALMPSRTWEGTLLQGTKPEECVYFVHSFSARPEMESDTLATADYVGFNVVAAVHRGPIMGTQFHPEKSGEVGLRIVKAFLTL